MTAKPLMIDGLDAMRYMLEEVSPAMGVTDAAWFRVVAEK